MDSEVVSMQSEPGVWTAGGRAAANGGPPPPASKIRILLADGDPVTRARVRDVLEATTDIVVVAQASDGIEAVELAVFCRPDIVLSELHLRQIDGVEAMRRIHERAPDIQVVFLSTERRSAIQVDVMRAGACGVLSKETPVGGLVRAMHGIVRGEAATSRAVSQRLVEQLRDIPEAGSGVRPIRSTLTPREWEVLDGLCAGATPSSLAQSMRVAPATVKSHLKRVMAKLGAGSRDEAVALAREGFRLSENVM